MFHKVSVLTSFIIFCFSFFFVTGCKDATTSEGKFKQGAPKEKIINVRTQPVITKKIRPFIDAVGTLNPHDEVVVSSEVDGILKEIIKDEGDFVSKETLLATIDSTDYLLELKRAEALLKQTEATLVNIRQEYERKAALYKELLITKQQVDDLVTRLAVAEADRDSAKTAIDIARQKVSKTSIISPIAGLIQEKKVSSGNYVRGGTPLFTIVQTNPLKLLFSIQERDITRIKIGQDVSLSVDSFPDKTFSARITILFPNIDSKTRTLQVEAEVPNANGLLKPGGFAKIFIYTGAEIDTLLVPINALLYEGSNIRVFLADGEKAVESLVHVGQKYGEEMTILNGVKIGDMVIVAGQQNLFDGAKIKSQLNMSEGKK